MLSICMPPKPAFVAGGIVYTDEILLTEPPKRPLTPPFAKYPSVIEGRRGDGYYSSTPPKALLSKVCAPAVMINFKFKYF